MKADAITNRILADARDSAEKILADARARAEEIRRANADSLAKQRDSAMSRAKSDGDEERDRMLRMAELDQRKKLLAMKRGLIDRAFSEALLKMQNMDAASARAFVMGLIDSAARGGEEIVVSTGYESVFDASFAGEVNAILEKSGRPALSLAAQARSLGGGVMLRQGGMEINLSYPAVLGEARADLEAEVAAMLFS